MGGASVFVDSHENHDLRECVLTVVRMRCPPVGVADVEMARPRVGAGTPHRVLRHS